MILNSFGKHQVIVKYGVKRDNKKIRVQNCYSPLQHHLKLGRQQESLAGCLSLSEMWEMSH